MFQSKSKWVEEGEKNTKYFLNLEKKNYLNKLISTLSIDGKITTNKNEISNELTNFYQELYSEKLKTTSDSYKSTEEIFFKNIECPKLSSTQKNHCDNEINETEILNSLKNLRNG